MLKKQGGDADIFGREFVKNALGVVGAVVIADSGVVAPHDEMGAAVIFAREGVHYGFARPCIPHRCRKNAKHNSAFGVVSLNHGAVTGYSHLGGNIVLFGFAHKWVQQEPIHYFQRCFLNVFMGAVDRVACLETHYALPAALGKDFSGLSGGVAYFGEFVFGGTRQVKKPKIAAQQKFALRIDARHPGMRFLGCAVHLFCFAPLVVGVNFVNFHDSEGTVAFTKGNFIPLF